ncbi:MAG: glycosyltransferase [Cytophagales bacterium]|nr:glycosyltransferase [Armatimonadota bacterium]
MKEYLSMQSIQETPRQQARVQSTSRPLAITVLVPVYNERHLVASSIQRILQLESDLISRLEVIAVDDCSTDGSWELLEKLAETNKLLTVVRHERNQGKGAALRTALEFATGDVCVVHDADLEYNPGDIPSLLRPFIEEGADAVFGSRYMAAPYRRVLMHRHTLINKAITGVVNWVTDLDLSDVETCYKAVNTALLKSLPLRSNDFRFEVEITLKLAKRRARIFEVPIRYLPRSFGEGKKIRARDGILALLAAIKFSFVDDIYQRDAYGSHILNSLQMARRFNKWMGDTLRPHIGNRVLEIGAGIGTLTSQFIPRDLYVASDINPTYLHYLRSYAIGKPYLKVLTVDAGHNKDFDELEGQFDTAIMVNVLEHVPDEQAALKNLHRSLASGGKVVILVPQHPWLYGSLDSVLEHRERYTSTGLEASLEKAGFRVEQVFDFNRTSVPSWYLNGKMLHRTGFSVVQLKILELLMPAIRRLDRMWPWRGLSVIGIGVKD